MQRQGSIVNIAASFHSPVPKYSVYAATKVAVEKLSVLAGLPGQYR
jgi:short-subunit dehydrogenase